MGQSCSNVDLRNRFEDDRILEYDAFLKRLRQAKRVYLAEIQAKNVHSIHNYLTKVQMAELDRRKTEIHYQAQMNMVHLTPTDILDLKRSRNNLRTMLAIAYGMFLGKAAILKLQTICAKSSIDQKHDYCGVATVLLHHQEEHLLQQLHTTFNHFCTLYGKYTKRSVHVPFDLHVPLF
jgi:hypothetical protein